MSYQAILTPTLIINPGQVFLFQECQHYICSEFRGQFIMKEVGIVSIANVYIYKFNPNNLERNS